MSSVAWTRDGDIRVATLGDRVGQMLPAGSKFVWKVGHVSGLDSEDDARRNVEEMLTGHAAPPVVAPPEPAANALPAWAATPEDDGRAVRRDWTAEQYHADDRLSRSHLFEFDDEGAHMYSARHRERTVPPPAQTAAMRFGTLVHLRTLEPDEFSHRVWLKPENWNGRTNAAKSELAEIRARGLIECDAEEHGWIEGCAAAVLADPDARKLLDNCEREVTYTWTERIRLADDVIDVPCRARLDLARRGRMIADLKTTDDPRPEEFARAATRLGYHFQPPFYARPLRELFGTEPEFRFILVRSRPPHEVVVKNVKLADIKAFDKMVQRALERFAECVLTDTWSSPWERQGVTDLEFKPWQLESR